MSKSIRVLWLHTQPEHYFNLMMDDLNRASELEYVTAFTYRGAGTFKEVPVPRVGRTLILRPRAGKEKRRPGMWEGYHEDWRGELEPLDISAAIVSGYAGRTQRRVMAWCHERGIPVAMFSDSNLRGEQRGGRDGCAGRARRRMKKMMLARMAIRHVDCMLTANRLGVAYWRYYGEARERIVVCPYYADYQRITEAASVSREAALGAVGIEAGAKVILSSARLVPVKGLEMMVRTFVGSDLPRRGWVYAIAGRGPLEGELKALAGSEEGKSVKFLGFVQPRELLTLTRQAALFVLPSRYEPHGIVVQEAMAAGTPVLTSDVCGAGHDLVKEGVSGWRFVSGDEGDLARKLAAATGDEGLLAGMRAGTRRVFEEWFAQTNPVMVVDREVHRLLAARGSSSGGGANE